MTEIYLHIVARMADYMDTHPYIMSVSQNSGAGPTRKSTAVSGSGALYTQQGLSTSAKTGLPIRDRKNFATVIAVSRMHVLVLELQLRERQRRLFTSARSKFHQPRLNRCNLMTKRESRNQSAREKERQEAEPRQLSSQQV